VIAFYLQQLRLTLSARQDVRLRVCKNGVAYRGSLAISSGQIRPLQIRLAQIHLMQVGISQICLAQVCLFQVRSLKVSTLQI
jgi:sulfur relay (sulfurtransferase) complex TusBCD TusD component (DsrE family)